MVRLATSPGQALGITYGQATYTLVQQTCPWCHNTVLNKLDLNEVATQAETKQRQSFCRVVIATLEDFFDHGQYASGIGQTSDCPQCGTEGLDLQEIPQ